ncbi:MAG: glycosyltransferase family 1 protein [Candidatus Andersenbacteria bacterium]
MKLVIEARSLSGPGGGIQTYTRELISYLLKEPGKYDVTVLYSDKRQESIFPAAHGEVVPLHAEAFLPFWLNQQVPKALNRLQPDIVHFTKADVPVHKRFPTIVTIHDVIPLLLPNMQSPLRRLYWPRALQRAASQSDHILTISEASKRGIIEHLHVNPHKITVTPLGINHDHFKPVEQESVRRILRLYNITGPYILFVGTRDARKNIAALLRAFARIQNQIPHTVVIAGRAADKRDDTEHLVGELQLESRVRILGKVGYEDLPALYTAADIFVWPSIYEGWGFPPLEAMACGTPVITSDGGALPEAVGQEGIIVPFSEGTVASRLQDKDFVQRLSEEILRVLQDRALRDSLIQQGQRHAMQFSWPPVIQKTLAVYDRVAVL